MDAGRRLTASRAGAVARVARELLAWCTGRRRWFRVRGESMSPTLSPGDCVLVDPNRTELPAIGTLVVVMDPHASAVKMIKRLASRGARRFAVSSDNPMEARDSRQLGSLDPEQLVGAATLVFKRSGRLCLPGELGSRR